MYVSRLVNPPDFGLNAKDPTHFVDVPLLGAMPNLRLPGNDSIASVFLNVGKFSDSWFRSVVQHKTGGGPCVSYQDSKDTVTGYDCGSLASEHDVALPLPMIVTLDFAQIQASGCAPTLRL